MFQINIYQPKERGIGELLTLFQLRMKHSCVVVVDNLLYERMFGLCRLQNYSTLTLLSSGASCNLSHKLNCPFVSSEIREIHHCIGT